MTGVKTASAKSGLPEVEIIVPLYNAEPYLEKLHASFQMQEGVQIKKIHYILTESRDNTEKLLKKMKLKYKKVKKSDFSHSLTREEAAKSCKSPIIVFATEDIEIVRKDWLRNLVTPIHTGEVAATYSRQIPRDNSLERYTRHHNYPKESRIVSKDSLKSLGLSTFFFSDAASALDRRVFAELGYYDSLDLPISEDMYITYKLIMSGHKVKYCADSEVIHSHNFSLKEIYGRYYLTGEFFSMFPEINAYGTTSAGGSLAKSILFSALKEGNFKVILNFFPNMIARFIGLHAGKMNDRLSRLKVRSYHTVSVAMATYNGEKYLPEQLDSILANLRDSDELVISDDGSSDSTPSILRKYQKQDKRIRLLNGPGKGVKQNFANAIKNCKNDIIFLSDQDDVWYKDKVYTVLETFKKHHRATLVVHDAKVTDKSLRVTHPSFFKLKKSGPGVGKNIWRNSYIGCCMAFRRELVPRILPIPDDIEMHDQWIGILSDKFGESVFLPTPLIKYRRHGNNSAPMHHYGLIKMLRNRILLIKNLRKRYDDIVNKHPWLSRSVLLDFFLISAYGALTILAYYQIGHLTGAVLTILLGVGLACRYRIKYGYFANTLGLFALAWFGTIGLAAVQYHPAQQSWNAWSWVAFIGAYLAFLLGYAIQLKTELFPRLTSAASRLRDTLKAKLHRPAENYVTRKAFYNLITISTAVILFSFIAEAHIRGFVPALYDDMSAYMNFSVTGLHYFTVSSGLILALVVIYLLCFRRKTDRQATPFTPSEIFGLSVATITSLGIPILLVSRQLFIMTVVLATFSWIFIERKREIVTLLVALAVLFTGWTAIGALRRQSDAYLAEALEMFEEDKNEDGENYDSALAIRGMRTYMYLACNFDNFDLNLWRDEIHPYYGARTLFPAFALTGTKFLLPEYLTETKLKRITPTFNTYPIILAPYLDFGYVFIFIYMFIVGLLVRWYGHSNKTKFSNVLIRQIIKYCLIFSFFDNFFAVPATWFYIIALILIEWFFFSGKPVEYLDKVVFHGQK